MYEVVACCQFLLCSSIVFYGHFSDILPDILLNEFLYTLFQKRTKMYL